jgi:hypothetical protein
MTKRCFFCDVRDGRANAKPFHMADVADALMAFENPHPRKSRMASVIIAPRDHLVPYQRQQVSVVIWSQVMMALREVMPQLKAKYPDCIVGTTLELQEDEHVAIEIYARRKK